VAKNEQAEPVGIILFELYKGDTFETIQDPVIGQFTKKEYQDLYPPGTQLRCRRRANSLCVLPHYQGKGIGRELIKRSTARMKENKVIMYADLLSPDSAKLLKWMVDEALIEDFCRVGLPHKDADAGAGRYVFILKNETEA
jgi:GNAT superfamily N-acetyltransferase